MTGFVYIMGAGPGDPELLTLKAHNALLKADCVIYDRLVSDEIMALIPDAIDKIYAGKSCKKKAMSQDEINALLVKLGKEGKIVVRLKGGDPLLFGRGSEEAAELTQHNVAYEIIPGITSAQGCAAATGIPLTHRGLATGVRYITGHRMTKEEAEQPLDLNWQSLADPQTTIVVYMGLANLEIISRELIAHGLPANTPVAAIQQGTTPQQKTVVSDLANIVATVTQNNFEAPVLVFIGKVASLAKP